MFGSIRSFFARVFRRGSRSEEAGPGGIGGAPGVRPVMMSIPAAPLTLMNRIDKLGEEEREMLRTAEEAIRRGYPDQARIAYWKAVRFYLAGERPLKAIAVLSSILRIAPNDVEAWIARAQANVALDRRRDAALSYFEAANVLESSGDLARALEMLEMCVDLDPELDGLPARYRKLGGQRDVWSGRPDAQRFASVAGGVAMPGRSASAMMMPGSVQGSLQPTPRSSSSMLQGVAAPMPQRSSSAMHGVVPARQPSAMSSPAAIPLPPSDQPPRAPTNTPRSSGSGLPALSNRSQSSMSSRAPIATPRSSSAMPPVRAPSVHDQMLQAVVPIVAGAPATPADPGTHDIGAPMELDLELDEGEMPGPSVATVDPSGAMELPELDPVVPSDPDPPREYELEMPAPAPRPAPAPARPPPVSPMRQTRPMTRSLPEPAPAPVEYDVEVPETRPPPVSAARQTRAPVRFAIPSASTTYEPGLPSALIGSEHESEAQTSEAQTELGLPSIQDTDEDAPIVDPVVQGDAPTTAYDVRDLDALIRATKRGTR